LLRGGDGSAGIFRADTDTEEEADEIIESAVMRCDDVIDTRLTDMRKA
jgi:hypothetical protein